MVALEELVDQRLECLATWLLLSVGLVVDGGGVGEDGVEEVGEIGVHVVALLILSLLLLGLFGCVVLRGYAVVAHDSGENLSHEKCCFSLFSWMTVKQDVGTTGSYTTK